MLKDFISFIKNFGVIGLALGVIIGTAVKSVSDSLVANIINPILGKIVGESNLTQLVIWDIRIGAFINDVISFIILMAIIYYTVRLFISRFLTEEEKKKFQ